MSTSKEYKAVSNFFRNTAGLSREEVRKTIREVIKEITQDELRRYLGVNEFRLHIISAIRTHWHVSFDGYVKDMLPTAIRDIVYEEVKKNFDIGVFIDPKGPPPVG